MGVSRPKRLAEVLQHLGEPDHSNPEQGGSMDDNPKHSGGPRLVATERDGAATPFQHFNDEQLAIEFLFGKYIPDPSKNEWRLRQYLEPGSDRERQAQAALVRLLRSDAP